MQYHLKETKYETIYILRCMTSGGEFYALRTLGYIEGGIGLVKETGGWVGTHIPTGAKITPVLSEHNTARQALAEAENLISNSKDILETIQKLRSKKGYDTFLVDRHKQLLVDENNLAESTLD